jgi:hypothetical protein
LSVAFFTAGTPTINAPGSTWNPSVTTAPAAITAPRPIRECERTIAPIAIVTSSSTTVPWTMAE